MAIAKPKTYAHGVKTLLFDMLTEHLHKCREETFHRELLQWWRQCVEFLNNPLLWLSDDLFKEGLTEPLFPQSPAVIRREWWRCFGTMRSMPAHDLAYTYSVVPHSLYADDQTILSQQNECFLPVIFRPVASQHNLYRLATCSIS
jgi:hypothetical protein